MNEMQVNGACHCQQIKFKATVDPNAVRICHCNDCQILSGSAFRTSLPVAAEKFQLICGELKFYIKTAESGNQRAQYFCGTCGSQIYATTYQDEKVLNLRTGCIEQRNLLIPTAEKFTQSAMPWATNCLLKKPVITE
ncbi:GFA family protein [Aliikangiella sp. IMCC44653]